MVTSRDYNRRGCPVLPRNRGHYGVATAPSNWSPAPKKPRPNWRNRWRHSNINFVSWKKLERHRREDDASPPRRRVFSWARASRRTTKTTAAKTAQGDLEGENGVSSGINWRACSGRWTSSISAVGLFGRSNSSNGTDDGEGSPGRAEAAGGRGAARLWRVHVRRWLQPRDDFAPETQEDDIVSSASCMASAS